MDLTKALLILVNDHIEEQKKDPQMLSLAETVGMLGGCNCGEIHEGMLPEDVAKCIMAEMAEMGMLERARSYFSKMTADSLLEETSLYEVMADLGEIDWH